MNVFFFTWLISTLLIALTAYGYRSLRLKKLAGISEFHWPGVLVLSLLVGLAPALIADKTWSKTVPVPEGVGQKPTIVDKKN